jgi:hypothetical protein
LADACEWVGGGGFPPIQGPTEDGPKPGDRALGGEGRIDGFPESVES